MNHEQIRQRPDHEGPPQAAGRRDRCAAGRRDRPGEQQERRAAAAAAARRRSTCWWSRTAWRAGRPKGRRWRRRSRRPKGRWPWCGAAKTLSRWPKRSSKSRRRRSIEPVTAKGGVMDGQRLSGRRGQGGEQVAEPAGAAEHPGRSNPQSRVRSCRPSCSVREASWPARSRRRAKKAAKRQRSE